MKITKIDCVSHYKKQDKGILKKKWRDLDEGKQREKIEARYNKQIESKIYKEFFRLKSGKDSERITKEKNEGIKSLYYLIKELYEGKENDLWELKNINLEILGDKERIIKGYKFKEDVYFFKEGDKEYYLRTLFNNLIEKVQNENREKVRKNKEFLDLKEIFKKYKDRKIDLLLKSINNNKINLEYKKENVNEEIYGINPTNDREMIFYELLKEIIEKKDEQKSILEEKLDNFDITNFLENIEKIFNEETEINIIKGKVLNELREYIKEKEENNSDNKLKQIYNLELKKYIENNFSYKKQKSKSKNGKNDYLYLNFLKKIMFIEEVDEKKEINKEKFKNKINSNFKNLFVQHILDYGKLLYYKENDEYIKNTGQLETKDLEYIKTKETLIRKMAVLVSFAANSYYNLFGRTENNILTQEISDDLLLGKVENERYIKGERNRKYVFKEKMLNYFFNSEIFGDNKIVEVLNAISSSIYNIRNGVNHFDKMVLGKYNNGLDLKDSDTIKDYFNFKKKEIQQDLKDRFISNNLQYYYTENEIKKYFEKYKFEILKTKASFAPNFKRILIKGENLSISESSNGYEFFKAYSESSDKNSEYNEFMKTRNFLLKELYYNNFYTEFLNNKAKFKEAVEKVKKNKEKRGGKSYDVIGNYNFSNNILEYISYIHKSEMERIEINTEKNRKDTSKHIRDFIEEVFLEGFIKYLDNNNFKFLKKRNEVDKERKEIVRNLNIQIEGLDILNENDSEILNLYLFFNMIDNKRISEFRNDMIKYKQFLVKRQDIDSKFLEIDIEKIEAIIEFVIITKEKLEILEDETKEQKKDNMNALFNKFYSSESEYDESLKKFIEEIVLNDKKNTPFYSTDGKTPIVHSNLEKMRKYGTENFLSKVLKDSKYTLNNMTTKEKFEAEVSDELKEYKILEKVSRFKENEKPKKVIEYYNDCRCYLHKEWIEKKKSKEKFEHKEWIENKKNKEEFEHKEIYKKIIEEIRKYNYLENKEKLQNVYLLHEMLSDLLARNVAFLNKWERDFKFIVIAIKQFLRENDKEKVDEFLNPYKSDGSRDNFSVTNYRSKMRLVINNIHENFMSLLFLNDNLAIREITANNFTWVNLRNYIAHFEYLHEEKDTISFIVQANLLIKLFSYDKKVQNHILKSIKTLLEKYNIQISFKIPKDEDKNETFRYEIKNQLYSKKGKMLGKNNKFEILENEFLENVKAMLEYSK